MRSYFWLNGEIIAEKGEAGGHGDQGTGRQREGVRRRGGMERRSGGKMVGQTTPEFETPRPQSVVFMALHGTRGCDVCVPGFI